MAVEHDNVDGVTEAESDGLSTDGVGDDERDRLTVPLASIDADCELLRVLLMTKDAERDGLGVEHAVRDADCEGLGGMVAATDEEGDLLAVDEN